jgi:hypothetical protein
MKTASEDTHRTIELLKQGPRRIKKVIRGVETARLYVRTDEEPWSISDILVHLRACSDVWGATIMNMLATDNPIQAYKSPRAFMNKPKYQDQEFDVALETYTLERKKLINVLTKLDDVGWSRPGTYTGVTPRHRDQTVLSLSKRMINHEQPHLDQIETLLK